MPTIIPNGTGFTHVQVYTNSIGTAELQVTSFHCGPILAEPNGEISLATVVKKCLFRTLPDNEFAVIHKARKQFNFDHFSGDGYVDELIGFMVPHFVPMQLRYLLEELGLWIQVANQRASAIATYINPRNFARWFMTFESTMTQILCSGILLVQLPRLPRFRLPYHLLMYRLKRSNDQKFNYGSKKTIGHIRKKRRLF